MHVVVVPHLDPFKALALRKAWIARELEMDPSDFDNIDIYEEDEDSSVVIPFLFANGIPAELLFDSQAEKSAYVAPVASSSASSSEIPVTKPETGEVELEELSTFVMLGKQGHSMWKEACAALRYFGTFSRLPLDVQLIVLSLCGPTTLLRLGCTNMNGMLIGRQDTFWSALYESDFQSTHRLLSEDAFSWMKCYREAFRYFAQATIMATQLGQLSSPWTYSRGVLFQHNSVSRRWIWNTAGKYILLPSMKMASWNEERQTLTVGQRRFTFLPVVNRFVSSDATRWAIMSIVNTLPPKSSVYITNRHVSAPKTLHIQGSIPIPMLMTVIFDIE